METRRRTRRIMSLTPLVDVVFLLLLFFALTLHFSPEEAISVDLPAASTAERQKEREAVLEVNREEMRLNGGKVSLDSLETELKRRFPPTEVIRIRADRNLPLSGLVDVVYVMRRAGFCRFDLTTRKPPR